MSVSRAVAIHEAAHRRAALAFGAVTARSQVRDGGRAGETRHYGVKGLFRRLCVTVAGYVGTRLAFGADAVALDISTDTDKAAALALRIASAGERSRLAKLGLSEPTEAMNARTFARAERLITLAEEHAAAVLDADRIALEDDARRLLAEGSLP